MVIVHIWKKPIGVAPAEAMSMIIVAEDIFFLEDQRGPRIGYMGSVDRTFARTEEREVKRLKREEYLRSKEEHRTRENSELASEEEIINMAAEDESNLTPLPWNKVFKFFIHLCNYF